MGGDTRTSRCGTSVMGVRVSTSMHRSSAECPNSTCAGCALARAAHAWRLPSVIDASARDQPDGKSLLTPGVRC